MQSESDKNMDNLLMIIGQASSQENIINIFNNNIKNPLIDAIIVSLCTFIGGVITKKVKSMKSRTELKMYFLENDLKDLRYYIATCGQKEDPCEKDEIKDGISENRQKLMPYFIKKVICKNKGNRYYIILADSGMGKSTFLRKLYIKYNSRLFNKKQMIIYPLSNDRDLKEIKDKTDAEKIKTVLLLDALDEDDFAIKNYQKRMKEILKAIDGYYKVIISCRTQFFLNQNSELEETGQVELSSKLKSRKFKKIYLSPFSDKDVKKYLYKKYKLNKKKINKAQKVVETSPYLMSRPMLLGYMDDLLNSDEKVLNDICQIYEIIVHSWIEREIYGTITKEVLETFTKEVAVYMLLHNKMILLSEDIDYLCSEIKIEEFNPIFGRAKSLLNRNKSGEYKFAHKSIFEYLISKISIEDESNNNHIRKILLMKIKEKRINKIFYEVMSLEKINSNLTNLCYLMITKSPSRLNFDSVDLRGTIFKNCILSKASFESSILAETIFEKVNLDSCKFGRAELSASEFNGVNLTYSDFYNASLYKAKFFNSNLKGANLQDADLSECFFYNTNLENVILNRNCLEKMLLHKDKFKMLNLQGASLKNEDLRGMDLKGISFRGYKLENIMLAGMDLQDLDFGGAILRDARLYQAKMENANLTSTNLQGAYLAWTELQGASLIGADLSNAKLYRANLEGSDLRGAKFYHADLTGVDLSKAICDREQFIGAYYEKIELRREYYNNPNLFVEKKYIGNVATEKHYKFLKENGFLQQVVYLKLNNKI